MSLNCEGIIQITNTNIITKYMRCCKLYPLSPSSLKAFKEFINNHVTDNDFQSIQNDIASYSNYLIGQEGSQKNASVLFKLCNYDRSSMVNLCTHIECFEYHESNEFHPLFLSFTANTLEMFSSSERQICFGNIIEQFDSIEDVVNDLETYSYRENLSDIMDVMGFEDINKSNLFAKELKNAITVTFVHEKQKCKEMVLSMFQLWSVWLNNEDESVEEIANLFDVLTPQKYSAYRDIFIRSLVTQYLQRFGGSTCTKDKVNAFISAKYGIDNYCNKGKVLNTKLLPYMPLLTYLLNENKMRLSNLKLAQMCFLVTITRAIPNIAHTLHNNTQNKAIHFDIALIFDSNIKKGIEKLVCNKSKNFLKPIKRKRIKRSKYFKNSNYFDFNNFYDYLFTNVMDEMKRVNYDLVRIYVDMTTLSSLQYYPTFYVELTNNKVEFDGKIDIFSALLARKRYVSCLGFVRKCVGNTNADNKLMLLSNIIAPSCDGQQKYKHLMYLQYSLGIMRFMKDDIYNLLPNFFTSEMADHNKPLFKREENNETHLEDNIYKKLLEEFNQFPFHK